MPFALESPRVRSLQQSVADLWEYQLRREHAELVEENQALRHAVETLTILQARLESEIAVLMERLKASETECAKFATKDEVSVMLERLRVLESNRETINCQNLSANGMRGLLSDSSQDAYRRLEPEVAPCHTSPKQPSTSLDHNGSVGLDPRTVLPQSIHCQPDLPVIQNTTSTSLKPLHRDTATKRKQPVFKNQQRLSYRPPPLFQNGLTFDVWVQSVDPHSLSIPSDKHGVFISRFMEGIDADSDRKRILNHLDMNYPGKVVRERNKSGRATGIIDYLLNWNEFRQAMVDLKITRPAGDNGQADPPRKQRKVNK